MGRSHAHYWRDATKIILKTCVRSCKHGWTGAGGMALLQQRGEESLPITRHQQQNKQRGGSSSSVISTTPAISALMPATCTRTQQRRQASKQSSDGIFCREEEEHKAPREQRGKDAHGRGKHKRDGAMGGLFPQQDRRRTLPSACNATALSGACGTLSPTCASRCFSPSGPSA